MNHAELIAQNKEQAITLYRGLWGVKEIARKIGISERQVYRYISEYRAETEEDGNSDGITANVS